MARTYAPLPGLGTTYPTPDTRQSRAHTGYRARPLAERRAKGLGLLLALFALLVIGLMSAAVVLAIGQADMILPGVSVGGVPLAGFTQERAAQELDRVWNQELRITLVNTTDPSQVWLIAPLDFGLSVDAQASAGLAFAVGRGQGAWHQLRATLQAYFQPLDIRPQVAFDPLLALQAYQGYARALAQPALDASLSLEAGQVIIRPSQEGRELDPLASLELLGADPAAALLDYQLVPLITRAVEPGLAQVDQQADQLEGLLQRELILTAYDPVADEWFRWSPGREQIASWIVLERSVGGYSIAVDERAVQSYLESISGELGDGRLLELDAAAAIDGLYGKQVEPVQIRYGQRRYTVQAGDTMISISFAVNIPYWKWMELNPQVEARGLVVGERLLMPPKDAMLELPVVMNKRIVVSLSEQHMWLFQDGHLIADHVVSTGIPNSPTMPGIFQIKSRYLNAYASNWDLYMPHFLGIYNATPNLLNGIHGLPLLSNGVRLWANVLGQPASYGCIILDLQAAEHLYGWAEDGVVVEIRD